MAFKPYHGHEMAIEVTAGEDIPYYSLVKFHATDKTKVVKATAGSVPAGVAIPSEDSMGSDGSGGIVKKTLWKLGERLTIYDLGVVPVKLGETVTAGQKCVPGATAGLAYAHDEPTFTDAVDSELTAPTVPTEYAKATIDTALDTYNTAVEGAINGLVDVINGLIDSIQGARTADASVLGKFMTGGDSGDIAFVKITE
jgi:hypothetical protein